MDSCLRAASAVESLFISLGTCRRVDGGAADREPTFAMLRGVKSRVEQLGYLTNVSCHDESTKELAVGKGYVTRKEKWRDREEAVEELRGGDGA